jgi:hypothetical protein
VLSPSQAQEHRLARSIGAELCLGALGDGRAGRKSLDAACLAAPAERAAIIYADVAAFSGRASAPVIDPPVEHNPGSNAGSEDGKENVAITAPRAPQGFR